MVDWADRHRLYWDARLSSLSASARAHLYENYRVTKQSPTPGARMKSGVFRATSNGGAFSPTPIVVAAPSES
jgi:hypothetical protein